MTKATGGSIGNKTVDEITKGKELHHGVVQKQWKVNEKPNDLI